MKFSRARGSLTAAVCAGAGFIASASTADAQGAAQPADVTQGSTLDEIVVTAQRREQRLQDVPISITAIDAETLDRRNISGVNDLVGLAPNLTIAGNGSKATPAIAIRGAITTDVDPSYELPVGLYVDGVYVGKTAGASLAMPGIDHIEVLRGPQGTLFGRNTLAGAINVVTRKPSGQLGGSLKAGFGDRDRRLVSGMLDLPAFGDFSVQVSGLHEEQNGDVRFVTNPFSNVAQAQPLTTNRADSLDSDAARIAVRYTPSDTVTVDYSLLYSRFDNTPPYSQLVSVGAGGLFDPASPSYAGALVGGQYLGFPANLYVVPDYTDEGYSNGSYNNTPLFERLQTRIHSLTAEWNVADALTLKSISGYRSMDFANSGDFDGSPLPLAGTQRYLDYSTFSQEFQAIGKVSTIDYTVGLYYFEDDGAKRDFQQYFGLANYLDRQVGFTSEAYAAYTQVEWKPPVLNEQLTLTAGLRYNHEEKSTDPFIVRVFNNGAPTQTVVPDTTFASKTWTGTTPTFVAKYDFTPNFNVYARYAKGFKSGGFNASVNDPVLSVLPFNPETVKSYEIGAKALFADRRVQVNFAAFENKSTDAQVSVILGDGSVSAVQQNAGGVKVTGLELDILAQPVDWLQLRAALGMLDGEYTRFISANVDVANDRTFAYAPDLTANASIDARLFTGDIGKLHLVVDYTHSDEYWGQVSPYAFSFKSEAYDLVDVRLTLQDIPLGNSSVEAALWVKNVTDDMYQTAGANFGAGFGGLTYANFNLPRTVGFDMTYRF